eukprot:4099385-Amphidinium_carterae.1
MLRVSLPGWARLARLKWHHTMMQHNLLQSVSAGLGPFVLQVALRPFETLGELKARLKREEAQVVELRTQSELRCIDALTTRRKDDQAMRETKMWFHCHGWSQSPCRW